MNKQISEGITCESKTMPEIKEVEKVPTMSNNAKILPESTTAKRDSIPGSSSQNQIQEVRDSTSKVSNETQGPANVFTSEFKKCTFPPSFVSEKEDK